MSSAAPKKSLVLGIDATNLRVGGGKHYIISLLRHAEPFLSDVSAVVVWAPTITLDALPDVPWLKKRHLPVFERSFWKRGIWQWMKLPAVARREGCHLLFVPGGLAPGRFRRKVVLFQNLLPFDDSADLSEFSFGLRTRVRLLRWLYRLSLKDVSGIIFLAPHAQSTILKTTGQQHVPQAVIPHGLEDRFRRTTTGVLSIGEAVGSGIIRILYASAIDLYKHPWHVVASVAMLRDATGWPLQLILAGPAAGRAMSRLEASIKQYDPTGAFVQYIGEVPHEAMPDLYATADLAVFASSCENLPMIILEQMAMGLPIACSDHPAMRGLLGEDAEWFDATHPASISDAIRRMIEDPELCAERVARNRAKADQYRWPDVARQTFAFLRAMAKKA